MKRRLFSVTLVLFLIFLMFPNLALAAPTTLSAGDIVFVGLNSDGDDGFSFLLLKNITADTSVYITDKGWNDGSGFATNIGEGIVKWTAGTDLSAGTVVYIRTSINGSVGGGGITNLEATPGTAIWIDSNDNELIYSTATSSQYITISYTGDQVFIYQGTHASPTLIAGIHYNVEISSSESNWDGSAASNKTSALPDALTNGVNAIWVYAPGPDEEDCFIYDSSTTAGTPSELRTQICDVSNWNTRDDNTPYNIAPSEFSFTVLADNDPPTDIELSSNTIDENVSANSVIGTLSTTDPDAGNTFTYTLVSGSGDSDNAAFNISGNNLRITNSPNFEQQSSYSIRLRTTDQDNASYEESFTISINDINEAPTDIALSPNYLDENVSANSTVGTLSTADADAGNTFTYTLVSGSGDSDNAAFNISGNNLRITNSPNFEQQSSYSIRLRTTDQDNASYEESFTISINDINEAPTDIALSSNYLDENVSANSTVGTLSTADADAGNTFTYTLVSGSGDSDNAAFNISGDNLRITNSPNFEQQSSYSIRLRTTDQDNASYEESFTISINDINEAPTDIALSSYSIDENVSVNSIVGTLNTTDPDAGNTFTYTLVSGSGDSDNAAFNISGNNLRIASSPNFEQQSSYSIRLRTTDQDNASYEESFTISINDVNEAPTDIALSSYSIHENVSANSTVGTLSTADPDAGDTFTYTLVSGSGGSDNAAFNISGDSLRITNSPDYEQQSSYSIRVRTTDQGSASYEEVFTISINDINDLPNRISTVPATDTANVVVNTAYTLDLSTVFEDVDSDSLTYQVNVDGAGYNAAAQSYSYTPTAVGAYQLVFRANDGTDYSNTYTVTLTATEPNTVPNRKSTVPATGTASVTAGTAYTIDLSVLFEDADSNSLTYEVNINGEGYIAAAKSYSYKPDSAGVYTLVFRVFDGIDYSTDTYTVILTVNGIENPETGKPISMLYTLLFIGTIAAIVLFGLRRARQAA